MTTSMEIKRTIKENNIALKYKGKDAWKNTLESVGFYQGIEANEDYTIAKNGWKKLPANCTVRFYGCYATYLSKRKDIENTGLFYHVAYPLMPLWFTDVVKEFNDLFKNIQLEITDSKEQNLFFNERKTVAWGETRQVQVIKYRMEYGSRIGSYYKKCLVPLVKFHYSENYNPIIRYYFNYFLVILFRMLSYTEKFHHPLQNTPSKKLEYLCRLNNKNKGYRSFSEKDTNVEQIKLLDDIDLVNSNVDKIHHRSLTSLRQTDLLNVLTGGKYVKKTDFGFRIERINKAKKNPSVCNCDACRRARGEI